MCPLSDSVPILKHEKHLIRIFVHSQGKAAKMHQYASHYQISEVYIITYLKSTTAERMFMKFDNGEIVTLLLSSD
jgi:hypothetical protein